MGKRLQERTTGLQGRYMKRGSFLIVIVLFLVALLPNFKIWAQDTKPAGALEANKENSEIYGYDMRTASNSDAQKPKITEVTPEIPRTYYHFKDGRGLFYYNGKCGYLGADGRLIIEPEYSRGTLFAEGVALVEDTNSNLIILDKAGNEAFVSKEYKFPGTGGYFNNGTAILESKDNKHFVIINKSGKELGVIQKTGYVPRGKLSNGVIVWSLNNSNKIKLTDVTGKELSKEIITGFGANNFPQLNFNDKLLAIPDFDKSWNVIDTTGKKVFKENFEVLGQPSEGLIAFKRYGKWGYIDYKGKISIKPQYDSAHDFSNGLAAVSVNGKVGFIDKNNKMIIAPKFNAEPRLNLTSIEYYQFGSKGVAIIPDNNGTVIDKSGRVLLSANSGTTILYQGDGIICFYSNEKCKLYKFQ